MVAAAPPAGAHLAFDEREHRVARSAFFDERLAGLKRLIDWHVAEGTDCIGVVGTTGESPTVNVEEQDRKSTRLNSSH